jgi:hypothetical protein
MFPVLQPHDRPIRCDDGSECCVVYDRVVNISPQMYDRWHRRLCSAVLGYVNIMRKQKLTLWSHHYFVGLDRLLLYSKGQVDLVWENIGKGLDRLIEILYFYIRTFHEPQKCVITTIGCGTSHKYAKYTNLQCKML